MRAYKSYIRRVVLPDNNTSVKDISYWRDELFYDFLTYLGPISLIAFIPGIIMSIRQGIYVLAIADLIGLVGLTVIITARGLAIRQRKLIFIFIVYGLSVLLLYYVSRPATGMLYMLGITILCSVIYSYAAAYYSALANTLICIVFGGLIYAGVNIPAAADYSTLLWLVIASNLVVCSIICALGLNFLIRGLETTIAEKDTYHTALINASKALAHENDTKELKSEELKKNQRQLLKAQQVAHMGSWEFDFEENIIHWSEEARRIVGLVPEDKKINTLGASLSFLHPDDSDFVVQKIKSANESKTNTTFEHRIVRKDGLVRHIHSECKFEFDAEGKQVGLYGIAHDITEKKESEIELKQSLARLNAAQAVAHVGSWETDLLTQQVIWSAQTYHIFGVEPHDFSDSHPGFLSFVHPDDLATVEAAFAASLTQNSINTIEHRIVTPAGVVKNIEERWHVVYDKGEEVPVKAVGTCQDITARKITEEVLRKHDAYNYGLINSLSAHIAVINATGEIISVNEAWNRFVVNNNSVDLSACSEGSNYFEVCQRAVSAGEEQVEGVISGLKKVMDGQRRNFYYEYPCHSPNEQRWFAMRAVKFDGDTAMVVIAHEDITERVVSEGLLQQSQAGLKAIFENTDTGFILLDTAFNVQAFNQPVRQWSKLSFGLEMLQGHNLRRLLNEAEKPGFDLLMAGVMGGIT